jgi:hypothetical protein
MTMARYIQTSTPIFWDYMLTASGRRTAAHMLSSFGRQSHVFLGVEGHRYLFLRLIFQRSIDIQYILNLGGIMKRL